MEAFYVLLVASIIVFSEIFNIFKATGFKAIIFMLTWANKIFRKCYKNFES